MLENYLKEFRDHLCQNAIEYSKGRCMEWGIEVERRVRRRRIMPGERAGDSGLSAEDEVSRVLKMILDCFQQELTTRFRRLNDLNKKFGFLLDVRILLIRDGDENQESLQQHCLDLGNFYSTDISEQNYLVKLQTVRCCLSLVGAQYQQLRWIFFHLFCHTEMTFFQTYALHYKSCSQLQFQ